MKRRSNKEKWRRKGTSVTGWDGTERNKGWKRSRKIYMGSKDKRRRKKKAYGTKSDGTRETIQDKERNIMK